MLRSSLSLKQPIKQCPGMFSSHHLIDGPQFSKYPSSSTPRAPRGVGGGTGTGVGGGRGVGGGGTGVGGVGPGEGAGDGGGDGAGWAGQSPTAEHDFDQSVLHRPPLPPDGYPPQVLASPHALQQHLASPPEGLGAGGLGTGAGVGDGSGDGTGPPVQSPSPLHDLE